MRICVRLVVYVLALSCFLPTLSAESWKFFFYMDASDRLADMAFKNITDIMRGAPNDNVEALIQLHAFGNTALRYRVTQSGLFFVDEVTLSGDNKHDFVAAATWALQNNNADHTMLVLSNHGWGALDPRWNAETNSWEAAEISISHDESAVSCALSPQTCEQKKSIKSLRQIHVRHHKGFMFDDTTHTYLSNDDLAVVLSYVSENVLKGKKIDIVAFDTCMGSMLEVATCIAPYAQYLFGVQSCALRDGFNYQEFIAALNHGNNPRHTAQEFVKAFDVYYAQHDEEEIYTCAALDLSYTGEVNDTLNRAVAQILQHPELNSALRRARDESPRFCLWPIYSDLIAFCKLIEHHTQLPQEISDALHEVHQASQHFVIAHCGGSTTKDNAHGFSIYLPFKEVDSSYENSLFARQSQWINLLKVLCAAN